MVSIKDNKIYVKPTIHIMTRSPAVGKCKTRLIPALGARGATRVHKQLMDITIELALTSQLNVHAHVEGDIRHPKILQMRRRGIRIHRQIEGNLGRRMLHAARKTSGPSIILGTDAPKLTREDVIDASSGLKLASSIIYKPASDGGFVLLGISNPNPVNFNPISWGSRSVLLQSLKCARRAKCDIKLLTPQDDLDTARDYYAARQAGLLTPY